MYLALNFIMQVEAIASQDDILIENMKNSISVNKSVPRAEWIEGIDTLADSLEASNATSAADGGNVRVYFDGIANNITNGAEHKFIEKRLLDILRNKNIPYSVQNPDSPFPPENVSCVLKGSIDNLSVIINNKKTNAYTIKLQLLKNDTQVWADSVMLVPQPLMETIQSQPVQTNTQVIISDAIMNSHMRPIRPLRPIHGFSPKPAIVINGNGITIIPTGHYRMHPFSPRPNPIIIVPTPKTPRPTQPSPPRDEAKPAQRPMPLPPPHR